MATGAELSRRGYDVAFTLGNTPRLDLLCSAPNGVAFKVQVKGISHPSGFYMQPPFLTSRADNELFLVVVFVPLNEKAFRFFILSHKEAIAESRKMPKKRQDGRPYTKGSGLNFGSVTPYESAWETFPR
jgi:hypothetical protein